MIEEPQACENTDRELWRDEEVDGFSPSIHVTSDGSIGINVCGTVHVKSIRRWHELAERDMEIGLTGSYSGSLSGDAPVHSYTPSKMDSLNQYLMILFESNRCGHKVDNEIDEALKAFKTEVGI